MLSTEPPLLRDRSAALVAVVALIGSAFALWYTLVVDGKTFADVVTRNTWDDGWTFERIARRGYAGLQSKDYRCLALYPLVARLVSPLCGGIVNSLFAVSVVAHALSCVLFLRLVRRHYLGARGALVLALLFTAARTTQAVTRVALRGQPPIELLASLQSSEPLYMVFALASFDALKRDRALTAFAWLVPATLTRGAGIFVAGGYALWLLVRRDRRFLLAVIPAAALAAHFAYFAIVGGDFFLFFRGSRDAYYPNGVWTWPFHDLVRLFTVSGFWANPPQWTWFDTRAGYALQMLYCIGGIVLLWHWDAPAFFATLPALATAVSLNGWALHPRYYIVLYALPIAWALAVRRLIDGAQAEPTATE